MEWARLVLHNKVFSTPMLFWYLHVGEVLPHLTQRLCCLLCCRYWFIHLGRPLQPTVKDYSKRRLFFTYKNITSKFLLRMCSSWWLLLWFDSNSNQNWIYFLFRRRKKISINLFKISFLFDLIFFLSHFDWQMMSS